MDRAHWKSPSFQGRPHSRNPRYRGQGGGGQGFGTPRGYSPQWQQSSPSPYHQQQYRFQSGGSPFNPQHRSPYDSQFFATSTPVHGSGGGGRRPFFRGGGGRFNKSQSFGSSSFDRNTPGDIENWISPEMWSDPWRHLMDTPTTPTRSLDKTASPEDEGNNANYTKFANSDFSVSDSLEVQTRPEIDDQQDLTNEQSNNTGAS